MATTKKRKLNTELLKRLLMRFARMRHLKHFDMSDVVKKTSCGTAMCIAGHALDLAGYKLSYNRRNDCFTWFRPNGTTVGDELKEAAELLGLDYDAATNTIFDSQTGNYRMKENGLFMRFDLKKPKQAALLIQEMIEKAEAFK